MGSAFLLNLKTLYLIKTTKSQLLRGLTESLDYEL
jgi:hypothetical protein